MTIAITAPAHGSAPVAAFPRRIARCLVLFSLALLFASSPATGQCAPRTVHVLVALCDNFNQGIVPLPLKIGNGRDPANNLYWGAAFGVKTFIKKQADWKLMGQADPGDPKILERLVFRHATEDVYLVADAYDGAAIRQTTEDFLAYAAGRGKKSVLLSGERIHAGGDAALVVYIGHNGLMDFTLSQTPSAADGKKRDAAVFACQSQRYFAPLLAKAGATPTLLTTGNMCPEAYGLHALLTAWLRNEKAPALRERVATAYDKYQKCGIGGARRLFVTQ